MSDDYYRVFYYWEPAINHHHYTLDSEAVLFHDHAGARDHTHNNTAYNDHGSPGVRVDFGPAHYNNDVVRVHHTNNRYTVVNDYDPSDDNVTLNVTGFKAVDLDDFRGS